MGLCCSFDSLAAWLRSWPTYTTGLRLGFPDGSERDPSLTATEIAADGQFLKQMPNGVHLASFQLVTAVAV